jgi:hypothetical protein
MNDSNPEQLILKKRLNSFRSTKGSLVRVPDELIIDIIRAWERWPGSAKTFYSSIGIKREQLASLIKKGKRLLKDGKDTLGPFTPIDIKNPPGQHKVPIILNWDKKKSIKFYEVDHLIEFLKKAS